MHVEKYTAGQVGGLLSHDERIGENHSNEYIDMARSHLNYNLASGDPAAKLKKRLSETQKVKRDNINVMCSWVVTQPKEIESKDSEKFFEKMFEFFSERYGSENVVSAYVHLDEKTPHMHFKFVPVKENSLNAKAVINRNELKIVHKDADKFMQIQFGQAGLINNLAMLNKSNVDLETFKAIKELEEVKSELKARTDELNELIDQYNADLGDFKALRDQKAILQREIPTLERKVREEAKNDSFWQNVLWMIEDVRKVTRSDDFFSLANDFLKEYREARDEHYSRYDSLMWALKQIPELVEKYQEDERELEL